MPTELEFYPVVEGPIVNPEQNQADPAQLKSNNDIEAPFLSWVLVAIIFFFTPLLVVSYGDLPAEKAQPSQASSVQGAAIPIHTKLTLPSSTR
ncbi:MAG: hypothetical protein OEZ47_08450 [Gammaproteobacteria bacterium]|nr:hypothetical protein [Gammaproteobacteria bacterium]